MQSTSHRPKTRFTDSFRRAALILLSLALLLTSTPVCQVPALAATTSAVSKTSKTLKLSGVSKPTTITQGAVFYVRGRVSSSHRIREVRVSIQNAGGNVVSSRKVQPYSYSYDLARVDAYIRFDRAKAGRNYYIISAKDSKGSVKLSIPFTVKKRASSGSTASGGEKNYLGYARYTGVNYRGQTSSSRRLKALDKARKMVTVKWKCQASFPTWYNYEGYYSTTKATDGTVSRKFLKGKTYVGIPFSMYNHSYDDTAWINVVKKGYSTSTLSAPYYSYTHLTTSKGSDCSYFVYLCMKAAGANVNYQTTYTMSNGQYYKKISKSRLKPGDILLSYSHVRLYAGKVGNRYATFEAAGDGSKTRYRLYTASELKNYSAYRYKKW